MNALRRRPLFAWIALLAITLAALMPTVSRALAPSRAELPAGWVEICSGAGMQWVSLQTGETVRTHPGDPDAPQAPLLDACAYCVLAAERPTPPTQASLFLSLPGRAVAPGAPPAYRAPLLAGATVRARGPPLNSADPSVA